MSNTGKISLTLLVERIIARFIWVMVIAVVGFIVIATASCLLPKEHKAHHDVYRPLDRPKRIPELGNMPATTGTFPHPERDGNENITGCINEDAYRSNVSEDTKYPTQVAGPFEEEIPAYALTWKSTYDPQFPPKARHLIKSLIGREMVKGYCEIWSYAPIHPMDKFSDAIIVASNEWYSGGYEYLMLGKKANDWIVIGEFQGGFVLLLDEKNPFVYRVIAYNRSGSTFQTVYEYKHGSFKQTSQERLPSAFTNTLQWESFWRTLNESSHAHR